MKEDLQGKIGTKIQYGKDCSKLSKLIFEATNRQVSSSTLKRFFGIINSPFAPSKYTLDTLAIYLQFDNWQEYFNNFKKEMHPFPQQEAWDNLKTWVSIVTNASLKSLKNRIGRRFNGFPLRKFAEKRLEDFLSSTKIATAFIAPDGYGKSIIAGQLTEKFFKGADAKYPDDIVCLIDGSIIYNLIYQHQKVNQLYNLIDFNPAKSFSLVFRENPELVKGRFVMIIDGIDDIYSENEKVNLFIGNLLSIINTYENVGWFKLLITCSPSKWRMFVSQMQQNQLLKSFWFDVAFQGTDDDIVNIPLLKQKEIKTILQKNHFSQTFDELCFNHPDILDLISNPYQLHLFLSIYKKHETIRDIDLLNQYIIRAVLSSPYAEEKSVIVQSFFTLSGYGKKSSEVRKQDLNLSSSMIMAYNELIKNDILYEYSIIDNYLTLNTYVRFTDNILFSYYLANILIKENGLNIDFLKRMIADYSNTPHLQCNILRYTLKILFKEEHVELLKNIFSIIEKDKLPKNVPAFNMPCYVLTNVIGVELRKNQKLREMLIPYYAQSEAGRTLYFEKFFDIDCLVLHSGNDLDCYLQYNQSDEAKQYVCYMKFMKHFLGGNQEQCKTEYENSLNLKLAEGKGSLNTSFYFIPQIVYQSVYEKKVDENIIKEVYRMSDRLLQNGIQNRIELPQFEFAIIFALNYGRMNKEIIDLARYIFEKYDLTDLKSSCFYQLFLSVYARALLESGEAEKALEFYDQVKFKNVNIPEHMKNYVKIRLLLIKAEFLIYMGKTEKARHKLEKIKTISQMLKAIYFYNNAMEMEKRILTIS